MNELPRRIPRSAAAVAAAVCSLLLAAPAPGQEEGGEKLREKRLQHLVTLRPSVPLSADQLSALAAAAETSDAAKKRLGDNLIANVVVSAFAVRSNGRVSGNEPVGDSFYVDFRVFTRDDVPDEHLEQAFADAVKGMRGLLQRRIVDTLAEHDRAQLDALSQTLQKAAAEREELRQLAAAQGEPDVQTRRTLVADLEKQLLEAQIDLRTEEATQKRLQELADEAKKRFDGLQKRQVDLDAEYQKIHVEAVTLRDKMTRGATAELTAALADLERRQPLITEARNTAIAEAGGASAQLTSLAADARKTALAAHRAASRIHAIEEILAQQRKLLEAARADAVASAVAADKLAVLEARAKSLRERADAIEARLDALQPVQLVIWK